MGLPMACARSSPCFANGGQPSPAGNPGLAAPPRYPHSTGDFSPGSLFCALLCSPSAPREPSVNQTGTESWGTGARGARGRCSVLVSARGCPVNRIPPDTEAAEPQIPPGWCLTSHTSPSDAFKCLATLCFFLRKRWLNGPRAAGGGGGSLVPSCIPRRRVLGSATPGYPVILPSSLKLGWEPPATRKT